ncbi:hypothetical protein BDD12DRAFT_800868 [Trichophaea hybrida]|nr:hypothetical protein BDD12DRAFT_800868 [Trichophaea hybrida]
MVRRGAGGSLATPETTPEMINCSRCLSQPKELHVRNRVTLSGLLLKHASSPSHSTQFRKKRKQGKRKKKSEREKNQPFSIMNQSTASCPSTTAAADSKSTASMVPQSKLASAAAIAESAPEAKDTDSKNHTPITEEWVSPQLARRSTHHYEHDAAEFFGGPRHTAEEEQAIPKFHTRRESFNREDQKRLHYLYLMAEEERKKKGFSEVA